MSSILIICKFYHKHRQQSLNFQKVTVTLIFLFENLQIPSFYFREYLPKRKLDIKTVWNIFRKWKYLEIKHVKTHTLTKQWEAIWNNLKTILKTNSKTIGKNEYNLTQFQKQFRRSRAPGNKIVLEHMRCEWKAWPMAKYVAHEQHMHVEDYCRYTDHVGWLPTCLQ